MGCFPTVLAGSTEDSIERSRVFCPEFPRGEPPVARIVFSFLSILAVLVAYSLAPSPVIAENVPCKCGCNNFVCFCGENSDQPEDVRCFVKCPCQTTDKAYQESPSVSLNPWNMGYILCEAGKNILSYDGSLLDGHREPPSRPPPKIA
jgi:hypothetical protein